MQNEYNTLCMSCTGFCKQLAAATVIDCPKYDYNNAPLPDHSPLQQNYRELTSSEKKGIKDLITTMCANYDNHYKECLLLDTACPMLLKHYHNGKLCKYFKNAVLPLNQSLELGLQKTSSANKDCALCGVGFCTDTNKKYCSAACTKTAENLLRKVNSKVKILYRYFWCKLSNILAH